MSDEADIVIDAIQRIAVENNPRLESRLKTLLKRGTLASERGVGGSNQDDCCNQNMKGTTNDGSNVTDRAGLIPDDYDFGDHLEQLCGLNDCATGEPVCVNFSGTFTPPEGWDSLTEGPPSEYWTYDHTWRIYDYNFATNLGFDEYDPHAALQAAEADAKANPGYPSITSYRETLISETATKITYAVRFNASVALGYIDRVFEAIREDCSYINANCVITDSSQTVPTEWPSDGVPQIGLIDGRFVSYKADPDGDAYKFPAHTLTLCDGTGKRVKVAADIDGGHLVIPVDASGDPIAGTTATRYNPDGSVRTGGYIGAAQAANYILPPP